MGEDEASNTTLVYQARAGDDVEKKKEMVLDCAWERLGTWNQFVFLGACKCLQSQFQVLLCTILRWCLYHDLGILFLASICFSSFLFF